MVKAKRGEGEKDELWHRSFSGRTLRSHLFLGRSLIPQRIGDVDYGLREIARVHRRHGRSDSSVENRTAQKICGVGIVFPDPTPAVNPKKRLVLVTAPIRKASALIIRNNNGDAALEERDDHPHERPLSSRGSRSGSLVASITDVLDRPRLEIPVSRQVPRSLRNPTNPPPVTPVVGGPSHRTRAFSQRGLETSMHLWLPLAGLHLGFSPRTYWVSLARS